jgi:hypothetical protein
VCLCCVKCNFRTTWTRLTGPAPGPPGPDKGGTISDSPGPDREGSGFRTRWTRLTGPAPGPPGPDKGGFAVDSKSPLLSRVHRSRIFHFAFVVLTLQLCALFCVKLCQVQLCQVQFVCVLCQVQCVCLLCPIRMRFVHKPSKSVLLIISGGFMDNCRDNFTHVLWQTNQVCACCVQFSFVCFAMFIHVLRQAHLSRHVLCQVQLCAFCQLHLCSVADAFM